MKYLLSILLLSTSALAVKPFNIDLIDEVRTIENDQIMNEIQVTLWSSNHIYRMDESHPAVACLEQAYKSNSQVALSFGDNDQVILGCKVLGQGTE